MRRTPKQWLTLFKIQNESHLSVNAKKPVQSIEKSIASRGLLSQIATHKYCDGLPLYPQ
jgi:transposase